MRRSSSGARPGGSSPSKGPLGDSHRCGRAVLALRFDDGLRIVYKPRSLAVDQGFAALVEWINARGWRPRLRLPRLLARDGYGWVEYVEHQSCRSAEQLARF